MEIGILSYGITFICKKKEKTFICREGNFGDLEKKKEKKKDLKRKIKLQTSKI